MADCPVTIGDPAVGFTALAYDLYTGFATGSVGVVQQTVQSLAGLKIEPINFTVAFNVDANIGGYTFPTRPVPPDIAFNLSTKPPEPPSVRSALVNIDAAPAFDVQKPMINDLTAPNIVLPPQPGPAPAVDEIAVPDAPAIDLPSIPTLRAITLPTAPALNLPTFQGVRPNLTLQAPGNTFAFTPEEYTSALMDKTTATISTMLDGDFILPLAVSQALRSRAHADVDVQELRAVQQALEEYGGRGFTEPNGILVRRLSEVRQNNQNQRNALNRDIFIQEQKDAIENLRFAVAQGVSLESSKFATHVQFMQVSLDAAKTTVSIAVQIFDAQVSLFNAQEKAYETDAAVYRELLDGEIARITMYKTQIEAQGLIGQLNEQDVRIYAEVVRSLLAKVEIYKATIEGKQVQAEINKTRIEAYRAVVQAYAEEVRGYEAAWDGFKARADAELTKARVYEVSTNAYAARVGAWGKQQDTKIAAATLQISEQDLELRGYRGKLDAFVAQIQAERDRIGAGVSVFGGNVDLYRADASIQQVASEVQNRKVQIAIAKEQARVDVALKNVQLEIEQLEKLTALIIEKAKAIMTVEAQVAASSLSALTFHAGVSSSRSESKSCSTDIQILSSE